MKFHPNKTKIHTVSNAHDPENLFLYTLDSKIIEYTWVLALYRSSHGPSTQISYILRQIKN